MLDYDIANQMAPIEGGYRYQGMIPFQSNDQFIMDMNAGRPGFYDDLMSTHSPSGGISLDQFAHGQINPMGGLLSGSGNPDYGQFYRQNMQMHMPEPMQKRITMTTDPRSKFDKEGFNSGLQMMNMGLGLLD